MKLYEALNVKSPTHHDTTAQTTRTNHRTSIENQQKTYQNVLNKSKNHIKTHLKSPPKRPPLPPKRPQAASSGPMSLRCQLGPSGSSDLVAAAPLARLFGESPHQRSEKPEDLSKIPIFTDFFCFFVFFLKHLFSFCRLNHVFFFFFIFFQAPMRLQDQASPGPPCKLHGTRHGGRAEGSAPSATFFFEISLRLNLDFFFLCFFEILLSFFFDFVKGLMDLLMDLV